MSAENLGEECEGPDLFLVSKPAERDVPPHEFEVVQIRTVDSTVKLGGNIIKAAISNTETDDERFDGAERYFVMVHGKQVRMSFEEMRLMDRNRT